MNTPDERVTSAIRITPSHLRDRYGPEWRHDLVAATANGQSEEQLAQAATRLAIRLRGQWLARGLLFQEGSASLKIWLVAVAVVIVGNFLPFFPLFVALGLIVLTAVLMTVGRPTHASHVLMIVTLATGLAATIFVWWSIVAGVDAADAATPVPPVARWTGVGLLVLGVSVIGFVSAAVAAARRSGKRS
jgi:hypothetical protein